MSGRGKRWTGDKPGPDLARRFGHIVTGPAALRFGFAHDHYGLEVPAELFTCDPLEQWLLSEAVLARYHRYKLRVERETRQRVEADRQLEEQHQAGLEAVKALRDGG